MTSDMQQLVVDAVELTGAAPPALLDADAPVLSAGTIADSDAGAVYLIGLIGGKDVGKSSLVNALVGQDITPRSSFGEGTHTVIAYAHEAAGDSLHELLSREVPGRFSIITHKVASLRRQALLDLPDIDSHWAEHVQITRRMLRHMLYPIWIQSIEKYADQQPQKLLSQVAQGNDPTNFVFCLNKADQLIHRDGQLAADELRQDYAHRIAHALKLPASPRVHLISAMQREAFDLPELRRTLSSERSEKHVEQSIELAGRRRQKSLLSWLEVQKLPERARRAARLLHEAEELSAGRIAVPLMEEMIPRLTGDPAQRMALIEPVMSKRLSRWPIVNVIQTSLSPLMLLVRKNLSPGDGASAEAMVQAHLNPPGRPLATLIQTTFAQLRQFDPSIAPLYDSRRLWDDLPAAGAAADLSRRLTDTLQRQRDQAVRKIAGRAGLIATPIRVLLTVGALLWFPLLQPVLQRMLQGDFVPSVREIARLIVPLLGSSYLLHSATFLILYFAALWMVLRWDTHRRVNRLAARWANADIDSELSPAGVGARWLDELLEPLKQNCDRAGQLSRRLETARQTYTVGSSA